jgi:hypothetical protein
MDCSCTKSAAKVGLVLQQHLSEDPNDGPLIDKNILALALADAGTLRCSGWQPEAGKQGQKLVDERGMKLYNG